MGYVSLLRFTTTTLTLSVLCLANASFVSSVDASEHALFEFSTPDPSLSIGGAWAFPLRH